MSQKCGDDLIAARRFMNLCRDHMSEIFSGGKLPLLDVIERLGQIQGLAKLMHARSIYRSAQDLIDDLTRRRSAQACASSVLVLQKLIQQYETGLSEVAPVADRVISASQTNPVGPALISDLAAQQQARTILNPLIKFADSSDQGNLTSLINLTSNEVPPQIARRKIAPAQNVDVILPLLTNHWLRLARTQKKSISVSSSIDNAQLGQEQLKHLQTGLKHLGELLITQSVETPDQREARELSRSAHLALTARQSEQNLEILLSCEGVEPRKSDFNLIAETLEKTVGIKTELTSDSDLIRVVLTNMVLGNQGIVPRSAKGGLQ